MLLYLVILGSDNLGGTLLQVRKMSYEKLCLVVSLLYKAFFHTLKTCGFSLCWLNGSNKSKDRQFEFFCITWAACSERSDEKTAVLSQ